MLRDTGNPHYRAAIKSSIGSAMILSVCPSFDTVLVFLSYDICDDSAHYKVSKKGPFSFLTYCKGLIYHFLYPDLHLFLLITKKDVVPRRIRYRRNALLWIIRFLINSCYLYFLFVLFSFVYMCGGDRFDEGLATKRQILNPPTKANQ